MDNTLFKTSLHMFLISPSILKKQAEFNKILACSLNMISKLKMIRRLKCLYLVLYFIVKCAGVWKVQLLFDWQIEVVIVNYSLLLLLQPDVTLKLRVSVKQNMKILYFLCIMFMYIYKMVTVQTPYKTHPFNCLSPITCPTVL
jgi:hypothetical protein